MNKFENMDKLSPNSNCLFSLSKLEALTDGDKEAIGHFNTVFLQETVAKDLPLIRKYFADRDFQQMRKYAHKMKSSIELYCIVDIIPVIRELEKLATNEPDIDRMNSMLVNVENTLHTVREQMSQLV
jgi:hypothetical protein